MNAPQFGNLLDTACKKTVYYSGTSVVYEGMPVCYNYDTTTNINGWSDSSAAIGSTTAEGYQNEGKYIEVENPATANFMWFAGVVAAGKKIGTTGPCWLDIYVPNGSIVPLRTNASCTVGVTTLGISDGLQYFAVASGGDDPLPLALAEETVDRSGTSGIVLAKLDYPMVAVSAQNAFFAPSRNVASGYSYGVSIDGTNMLTGTAASKSYVFNITGYRETAAATGDSNDAMLKLAGNNEAANDSSFVFVGINAVMNNRDGGTLGRITNTISTSLKAGSTSAYAYALQLDIQDLAATAKTEFGGLDIALNREGVAATLEYGIQIRTRGTIQTDFAFPLYIRKDATDHGFACLFGVDAAATVCITSASSVTCSAKIPIKIAGSTYYIACGTTTG